MICIAWLINLDTPFCVNDDPLLWSAQYLAHPLQGPCTFQPRLGSTQPGVEPGPWRAGRPAPTAPEEREAEPAVRSLLPGGWGGLRGRFTQTPGFPRRCSLAAAAASGLSTRTASAPPAPGSDVPGMRKVLSGSAGRLAEVGRGPGLGGLGLARPGRAGAVLHSRSGGRAGGLRRPRLEGGTGSGAGVHRGAATAGSPGTLARCCQVGRSHGLFRKVAPRMPPQQSASPLPEKAPFSWELSFPALHLLVGNVSAQTPAGSNAQRKG